MIEGGLGRRLDRGKVGDIDHPAVDAVGLCDALDRLLEQRPVAVPYRKPGAGGEHAIGDRKADALGAAGDDRDPLFQIIDIHDMPLWSRVDA